MIRVFKGRHIPPISTSNVLVSSCPPDLSFVPSYANILKNRLSLVAQGLMDILKRTTIFALVSNFGRTIMNLPKQIINETAKDPPETIFHIGHDNDDDSNND